MIAAALFFDGACRGNPGPMGIGCLLIQDDKILSEVSGRLSENGTNNVAEWGALIYGLEVAVKYRITNLVVKGDSELVIRQMRGEYKVRKRHLVPFKIKARELCSKFNSVVFEHIPRELNQDADRLSNAALDDRGSKIYPVPSILNL